MSFLAWIVLGLISSFVASKIINKSGEGVVMDIVFGIIGAVAGGDWGKSLQHPGRSSWGSHRSVDLSRGGWQPHPPVSRRAISPRQV